MSLMDHQDLVRVETEPQKLQPQQVTANVAGDTDDAADAAVQKRMIGFLDRADSDYGQRVWAAIEVLA